MRKITYFDLGVWKGYEIDIFLDIARELNLDYKIIGLEADPVLFHDLFLKYRDNKNIIILNAAVSKEVRIEKVYQCPEEGIGNSIFPTKNNVDPAKYHSVLGIKFSSLLNAENLGDINILRFNIEGAELYLMEDIINDHKENRIDIFCGSTPDIEKVESIRHMRGYYDYLLKSANIYVSEFYYTYKTASMQTMKENLKNKILCLI